MEIQTLRQNKNTVFLLLICIYAIFFILYRIHFPEFLLLVAAVLSLLLRIFGSSAYGFIFRDKVRAASLGFILMVISGIVAANNVMVDFVPQYPDFYYYQIKVFANYFLAGVLCAASGWLFASENKTKNKRYLGYLAAVFLLIISIYFDFIRYFR